MNAIELSHVTKHFPGFTLQDLSLTVPSGTICGLVGENGAGKSTTIRLLMGALRPDSGTCTVLGADPPRRSFSPERGHRRGAGRGLFPREPERPSGGRRHGQDLPPLGRKTVPELPHRFGLPEKSPSRTSPVA
ncbi:MAG: ATP-binding cassette domain-containing protein [Dysosmobacter welbionis]